MAEVIVTIQDCRKLGFCIKAMKPWFAQQGFDFRDFVRNGLPASALRDTNDQYANDVIAQAEKRVANGD